jgi:hypothetical protein
MIALPAFGITNRTRSDFSVPVTVLVLTGVMIVVVMIVIVMLVCVTVVVLVIVVIVPAFVMMIVIMNMMMAMIMPVAAAVVGLERRHHRLRLETAFRQERRDVRAGRHAQAIGEDLDGDVAVAQRKHEPRAPRKILFAHFEHGFDVGHDFDQAAVVEEKAIVGAQQWRERKIELDASPLASKHEALLLRAVLDLEQQGVDDFAGRFAGAQDL